MRNGGAQGGRQNGYIGAYRCDAHNSNLAVLVLPSQGATAAIDRCMPAWTAVTKGQPNIFAHNAGIAMIKGISAAF